jgi:hypothetical protein
MLILKTKEKENPALSTHKKLKRGLDEILAKLKGPHYVKFEKTELYNSLYLGVAIVLFFLHGMSNYFRYL